MVIFVMVALGRCCSGAVTQRTWLAMGGIGFVIAAGLAAYGFNSAFGESLSLRTQPPLSPQNEAFKSPGGYVSGRS